MLSSGAMLEHHLHACPTCPGLYVGVVGVTEALGRLRDPDSGGPGRLGAPDSRVVGACAA